MMDIWSKNLRINSTMRAILIVMLLCVAGMMRSYAYHFSAVCSTGQTLYYNITDNTNHYVEITYPNYYGSSNPWGNYEKPTGRLVLPEIVTHEGVNYLVTSIADYAFFECQELTSVELSNSILAIGSTQIEFHDVYDFPGSFKNCTSLSSVSFGSALYSIGDGSFSGCSELTTISIPETITRIGREAFTGTGWYNEQPNGLLYLSDCCLGYKGPKPTGSLYLADNSRMIADFAFAKCDELIGALVIPNSVKYIGNGAFSSYLNPGTWSLHPNFTSLQLGNSVISIGKYAFSFVPFQGNLELPNSLISIGSGAFYNCNSFTGDIVIPNSVITIEKDAFCFCSGFTGNLVLPNSVTTIGSGAFANCTGLRGNLVIPNSVISIGGGAFANCSGFTGNLEIPNSVTTIGGNAFHDCTGFDGNLILCNPIDSIGASAFSGCYGLVGEITIPTSVLYIGKSAFKDCRSISKVNYNATSIIEENEWSDAPPFEGCYCTLSIGNNVESIPAFLFKNSGIIENVIIPNSVVDIGRSAFQNCTELTSVFFPESINSIGESAFKHCLGLTTLIVPNSVEFVGNSAFAECAGLTSVNITNAIIGDGMFSDCINLTSVAFNGSVISIGNNAFQNCDALETITIPNNVQHIGAKAFAYCSSLKTIFYNAINCNITTTWLEGCTSFDELIIGNNVQSIPSNSFTDCEGLINVILPESLTNVGAYAFKGCSGLASINIPGTVESIGNNAFSDCQNLTSIIIPKSLTSLGTFAFSNCSRLTNIYYQVEQGLESGTSPFNNCPNLATIHIDPCVLEIGSDVFRGCLTVHFIVALGETPAILDAGVFEDIKESAIVMVSCGNKINYYSNWNMFAFNNIIEDCGRYGINLGTVDNGGSISTSVTEAQMGEEIQLTVTPNPGMGLASLKVCNASDPSQIIPVSPAGKESSTYKFTMPPFEVVVMATFTANTSVNENIVDIIPISVYPNPTAGFVKIEAENIKHITISNILGQILYSAKANGNGFSYDFNGHEAGVYFIRIETKNGVITKRVVVSL
jgi:hypothetical protein